MSSNMTIKSGIYDPTKRFAFTNITSEPFTFHWNKSPITVKPNETIELPHHLAVLATTDLVDKVMMAEMNAKTEALKKINPMYLAPNQAGSLGVPAAREPYEKKICRELAPNETKISESQLGVIRSQLAETLATDLKSEKAQPITGGIAAAILSKEFADVNIPASK